MDDLDFLSQLLPSETGQATLRILLPDGTITSIERCISPWLFLDKCPLLFHAFEYGAHNGISQANIEASSQAAVVSLLRFCYTGSYLSPRDEETPKADLLHHAQVYKIADDFDVPELQVAAYFNFRQDTELACYLGPQRDLCETIRFLYQHLSSAQARKQHSLIEELLNYCLHVFKSQSLGKNPDFLEVVLDLPQFHKDLCRINMERGFEDEGAIDVLNLVSYTTSSPSLALHKRALGDFQHELMYDSSADEHFLSSLDTDSETERSPAKRRKSDATISTITLVRRLRAPRDLPEAFEDDSLSDEDGFTLVHRPKLETTTTSTATVKTQADSVLSSPELIASQSSDVESIADSENPHVSSEEEWDFLES